MHVSEIMDEELFRRRVGEGYINVQTHDEFGYAIYNYNRTAQYERVWDQATLTCRGLILDISGNVIARPFAKFFNYGEVVDEIPSRPPDFVQAKEDGSLGIVYPTPSGGFAVSTRGSLVSEQAQWATAWLNKHLPDFHQDPGTTTLVEIVYPKNRIVVDYKGFEGLIVLTCIDNLTGADISLRHSDNRLEHTDLYEIPSVAEALVTAQSDEMNSEEGFVLGWFNEGSPSFRVKIKNDEYVRLHGIIFGTSTKTIWSALKNGDPLDDVLDAVPDEFDNWVRSTVEDLTVQYVSLIRMVNSEYVTVVDSLSDKGYDRAEFAEVAKTTTYPGLMFALEDDKDITSKVWDMVEPEWSLPFTDQEES